MSDSTPVNADANIVKIALTGELTIYMVVEIKERLAEAMKVADQIEVDLSGITEMDTAGLQLMLIAKNNPGKEVRFVNHSPAVLRLVDLANLGGGLGDPLILSAKEVREGKLRGEPQ